MPARDRTAVAHRRTPSCTPAAAAPCTVTRTRAVQAVNDNRRRTAQQIELLLASIEQVTERHTLGEAIERYRSEHLLVDGNAENTIAWREQTCARLRSLFGRRDIAGRWRDAAAQLYADLSPSSASMTCNTLGRILNLAKRWGWRSDDHDLQGLCRIRSKQRDRVLILRERHELLSALDSFDTPRTALAAEVVRFVLHTGWRISEACGVEWVNVAEDFGSVYLPSTKTGPQTRGIGQEASSLLERRHAERGESHYVFPARRGDKPVGRRQPEEVMRQACIRAGIRVATPHTLRHTRATVSAQMQLPSKPTALAFGHTVEQQQTYVHPDLDDVRMIATTIDMGMLADRKVNRG